MKVHLLCGNTQFILFVDPLPPICLWTILQTNKGANDEVAEEDHLLMQMQISNFCSRATTKNKLVKPKLKDISIDYVLSAL